MNTIPLIKIIIDNSPCSGAIVCEVCGLMKSVWSGPHPGNAATGNLVCIDCAKTHAPDVYEQLVEATEGGRT